MNYEFRSLSLTQASGYQPLELVKLAQQLDNNTVFQQLRELPQIEISGLRTLEEIFLTIDNLQEDQIKQVEWAYCLYSKAQWDQDNPSRSNDTSESIWRIALSYPWLKKTLLWLLFLEYTNT